jgi:hypothetical protein
MSPEQARGEKVDYRTDIYSLGIMLYEMLAGAVPFQADSTFGMLMKHINEPPPPIKGLSSDMNTLVERALAKDPSMRYESAGELANEFMALFNGQTISPGTLHIAEMARKTAEASKLRSQQAAPPPSRFRWVRLVLEALLTLSLAFVLFKFVRPTGAALNSPAATATVDPNESVGRARFSFFNSDNDTATFTLTGITAPEQNSHLEAWLVNDNKTLRDVGKITFDTNGIGLRFSDPDGNNLLDGLAQIQITKEQDNASISKPTGEIAYSSVFPPQSLVHLRSLLVAYEKTPDNYPLIPGLWYYSADYVNFSINGDKDSKIIGLKEAYSKNDEAAIRARTEEIINQIVGNQSDQFLDYNKDGTIDNSPGDSPGDIATDGYGSFPNGTQDGYLQDSLLEAKLAGDASDSTSNIRDKSANLQICIQNMQDRLNSILTAALKLNQTPFGPDMEPIITDLSKLGDGLFNGIDANGNGLIEPIIGECGANDAYSTGTLMADMLLYPGANRIPPSGK